jgi:transketolase
LFNRAINRELDLTNLENYNCELNAKAATRNVSGKLLNIVTKDNPFIIGGSADVASSVKTNLSHSTHINKDSFDGQTINYGIREFSMGAINNGIALHGGLVAFGGTFFVFSDYLKPALRLSSLMGLNNFMLFSHDSVAVGEDGPTHQPIEQLAALRSLPNYTCIRPCNEEETKYAYMYTLKANNPTCIILTRQDLLTLHKANYEDFKKGAYYVSYNDSSEYTIIATGSEVNLAIEVSELLKKENINVNVVSMPMMDVFEKQDSEYKDYILKSGHDKTITLEMLSSYGWGKYGKYNLGIDEFGKSSKASAVI